MKPVNSIQNIKRVLQNVYEYGGNIIFYVSPNHLLLIQLRKFLYEELRLRNIIFKRQPHHNSHFIDDILDRQRFEQRIEYCIIKLKEFDVEEDKYLDLIKLALYKIIENINDRSFLNRGFIEYDQDAQPQIDDLLIDELVKCFATWYFPDDIYFYRFAIEHNLIIFNNEIKKWALTNIGNYALKLSTFELIIFLVSNEITFAQNDQYNFKHINININILHDILNPHNRNNVTQRARTPQILKIFNLVNDHLMPTAFGHRILNIVENRLGELLELNYLLIETEMSGFNFSFNNDKGIFDKIQSTLQSNLLDEYNRNSIKSILNLYINENYLDCLRIFYSNIEILLNKTIEGKGGTPNSLIGMKPKIDKLVKDKIISIKLGTWLEVVTSRNKIIHGNITENDSQVLKPLFEIVGSFWVNLINELEKNNHANAGELAPKSRRKPPDRPRYKDQNKIQKKEKLRFV